jgi:hypothetical protein
MDNKWIIQETDRLVKQMERYNAQCTNYEDAWENIDWKEYFVVCDMLKKLIKKLENG